MKFNKVYKQLMKEGDDLKQFYKDDERNQKTISEFVGDIFTTLKNRLGKKEVYDLKQIKEVIGTIVTWFNNFDWDKHSSFEDSSRDKIHYFKHVITNFFEDNIITIRDQEKIDAAAKELVVKLTDKDLNSDKQAQILSDYTKWLDNKEETTTTYDLFQFLDELE